MISSDVSDHRPPLSPQAGVHQQMPTAEQGLDEQQMAAYSAAYQQRWQLDPAPRYTSYQHNFNCSLLLGIPQCLKLPRSKFWEVYSLISTAFK